MRYFEKQAGILGYHDLDEISKESKIPKDRVKSYYHKLMVPNEGLYSKENVIKDFQKLEQVQDHYWKLNQQLRSTKQGSPKEKEFLGKYKNELDSRLKMVFQAAIDLENKYKKIKGK